MDHSCDQLAALIAWFFTSNRPEQVGRPPVKTTTQSLAVGGVDVGQEISGGLEKLRTALQGATDADSAKAALPKLQGAKGQIDKVNGLIGQLSPEQRKILAGLVNQFVSAQLPRLTQGAALDLRSPLKQQDGLACGAVANQSIVRPAPGCS